jgi:hypothetical protein
MHLFLNSVTSLFLLSEFLVSILISTSFQFFFRFKSCDRRQVFIAMILILPKVISSD